MQHVEDSSKTYRISRGEKNSAVCENKTVTWDAVCRVLGKHKLAQSKEQCGWFCGGSFKEGYRNNDNLECRSLLTIDIDDCEMSREEIVFELEMLGFALVAYSTWRSSAGAYRFRVVLPLSREITGDEYVAVMRWFATLTDLKIDESAFKPAQFMYMPSVSAELVGESFTLVLEGSEVDVDLPLSLPAEKDALLQYDIDKSNEFDAVEVDDDNFLEVAIAHEPLELSDEEVDSYLDAMADEAGDYAKWITVGQALHHQYRGNDYGKARWFEWSANSDKFDARLSESKWRSFTSDKRARPLTFASVIKMVKDRGISVGVVIRDEAKKMIESVADGVGREVNCEQEYDKLRRKLSKIPAHVVALTKRQQIAQDIFDGWGKGEGMTKAAIFRELCPAKKGVTVIESPSWVRDWVFIEKSCEYHDLKFNYSIKREAFNAKFDRMEECIAAERSASSMALTDWEMRTAIDKMYFPLAESMFKYEELWYVNSYKKRGVEPCEVLDEDGQKVIDMMLKHLEFTLVEPKERTILLDWMSHIVQKIGDRINWAILLQGTQGGGKTYFTKILQGILGSNATQLDPNQFTKGTFSGWAYGSVLNIVEEIRISGDNRWSIIDRMKPYITNDTIQVEEKFCDSRTVPNFTSYFLLTNYQDALPITSGDRRYCVLYSRCQSEEHLFELLGGENETNAYFVRLFNETDRRMDAICHYFMRREISADFVPKGRAPKTLSREKMIGYSVSHDSEEVKDLIAHYHCDVINETILDVTLLSKLNREEFEPSLANKLPKTSALNRILLQLGYEKMQDRINVPMPDGLKKKHTLWRKSSANENDVWIAAKKHYKIS